jgi:hypothetical protein
VDAGAFDVLHDPGDEHVASVAYRVDLDLDALQVLVDQERLLARDLRATAAKVLG